MKGRPIELQGDEDDLELAMLQESVAAVDVGRQRCGSCGRTPLVGEYVYRTADGVTDCELCRAARRDTPPAVVEQVRHGGARLTVQGRVPLVRPWIQSPGQADVAHG